jgi:hypothetical protein
MIIFFKGAMDCQGANHDFKDGPVFRLSFPGMGVLIPCNLSRIEYHIKKWKSKYATNSISLFTFCMLGKLSELSLDLGGLKLDEKYM